MFESSCTPMGVGYREDTMCARSCTPRELVIAETQYAGILVPAWEFIIAQTLVMCRY